MAPRPPQVPRCSFLAASLAGALTVAAAVTPVNAASLDQILGDAQAIPGVCVHLGCGNGTLSARLAQNATRLVHALESDEAQVRAARRSLQARGLYGVVSVELWASDRLPYADNLVNLLVAENPGPVSEAELVRVLAPNGLACIRRGEAWSVVRKPWPREFDEWTHWRHGADGNMVSRDQAVALPAGLRWVAGPAQDAGGKRWYNDHVLVSARGRYFYLRDDGITARDAFNGSLLWSRILKPHAFREVGTEVPEFLIPKPKIGTRLSKVRPVAIEDRLYVAAEGRLLALEAASGKTALDFGPVNSPREILVEGGLLVVSETNAVRAYGLSTRQRLWEFPIAAERIVAGDGSVFCLASNAIVRLDLDSGRERWRRQDPEAIPATTCTYHGGVLALELSSWRDDPGGCGIRAYAATDGRLLWRRDTRPDMTHWKESRTFFTRGLLWTQTEWNKIVGFDPQTGRQVQTWGSRGKHCASPVATDRFFIAPECEFTEWTTGAQTRARMFKSACRLPFIPANGLLYSFPVQCECFPMLRGYMALTATQPPDLISGPRLKLGPAFGRPAMRASPEEAAREWPTYRHDIHRSGSTPATVRQADLTRVWTAAVTTPRATPLAAEWDANPFVRGVITPPVIAGGRVFLAVPDEHCVVAFDAQTGKPSWSFTAGGRIDAPPTVAEGFCLFGAHDGWVYGLSAADGELAWQFRAAPSEARITAYGQMESLWPVPGSVLVDQGLAYVAAGRHPMADGGVRVCALKVRTGEAVWEQPVNSLVLSNWYGPLLPPLKKYVGCDFEPIDLLVKDGAAVAMSRWRFHPERGDVTLELTSAEYEALGQKVPRGLWGYGIRQTKMVQSKPPAVFDQAKIHTGATNDVALVLAGQTLIAADAEGVVRMGERSLKLEAPPVHDGLAVAQGSLYISTQSGKLIRCE